MAMFDTLKFARHLEASGLAPAVANGVAEAFVDALMGSNLATKDDLRATKDELRTEITATKDDIRATRDELRAEITGLRHDMDHGMELLRRDMELLRRDVTIKIGGMMVLATGVLLAAIRYLPPHP